MQSTIINNRDRAKQLIAFDGMQYGKCRPTDIDLSMDFQKRVFIFGELKGFPAQLTVGQRIHLEGIVDAIRAGGLWAYAVVAHHSTRECEHDVHAAEALVTSVYDGGGSWFKFNYTINLDNWITGVYNSHKKQEHIK